VFITDYHAKYYAYDLTLKNVSGVARLSRALFDAQVDLNPHQIEAAIFALKSPVSKGVILADEVGLGKTIEAGIILCQLWAERKRRILILAPASIRKQWALELFEKFSLPCVVLDAKEYNDIRKTGNPRPFDQKVIVIVSFNFAYKNKEEIRSIPWDMVVVDEAHKLRNAYRQSNHLGQAIRWAIEERKKILLTATPLQNSLLELYGLSTLIDDKTFGDIGAFRSMYMNAGADLTGLRSRLSNFCKRTLRNQVTEYVNYTERRTTTRPFDPTDDEQKFYDSVSAFLRRDDTYAIPRQRKHLIVLILRKLLASSTDAIAGTLQTMKDRLIALRDGRSDSVQLPEQIVDTEEMEPDLIEEYENDDEDVADNRDVTLPSLDMRLLTKEIDDLDKLIKWAHSIGTETKTKTLLKAIDIGFQNMSEMGANRKALIFTESRRTQESLKFFLESNGYKGQVILFNGTNSGPEAKAIYEEWKQKNDGTGRSSVSRGIDSRTAIIENFRDSASIMIATEAASEGVNLQFCSLVVNYDLPWNPQRIEQRIGRCHRYGQKYDVVVINFLNNRNAADQRVLQLLTEKFKLFNGVFGASDDVLGTIESGVDFEKRILSIYQNCRSTEEIEKAFKELRNELDESIQSRMAVTRTKLLENFDEDVHERFKVELTDTQEYLDSVGRKFWKLSQHMIGKRADWREADHSFVLSDPPTDSIDKGHYFLINKSRTQAGDTPQPESGRFLYRISHPLGEWVTEKGMGLETKLAEVAFDISRHPTKLTVINAIKGKSGVLTLTRLQIQSYEEEEYLLFSAFDDSGNSLDQETCEKLFNCDGTVTNGVPISQSNIDRLNQEAARHVQATISRSLEANNKHFNVAREGLERWAEDSILAAEDAIRETKEQINALRRQSRQAETLNEQKDLQEKIVQFEKKKRRQRQQIFDVEDVITEKRDKLIADLERRLSQKKAQSEVFTIRWKVI
jgi:superfamily II DNA/RNA helicase